MCEGGNEIGNSEMQAFTDGVCLQIFDQSQMRFDAPICE